MNDNLNPVFFKVSGKKKLLCDIASKLCFNLVDFCKLWEAQKIKKIEKKLLKSLKKCEFIALRDEESLARLKKFGEFKNAIVGADSVLILDDYSDGDLNCLTSKTKQALLSEGEKIGVCISSQRKIKDLEGFVKAFDNLLNKDNRKLFLIPMNEKTDLPLMKEVFENAKNKDKIFPLEGANERRTIMAAASKCDVIISSRLHLLILSANVSTPIEGISRGSKIANFLNNFGKKPVGSVDKCDFYVLAKEIEKDIVESSIFKNTRLNAYKSFTQKINECEKLFKKLQF